MPPLEIHSFELIWSFKIKISLGRVTLVNPFKYFPISIIQFTMNFSLRQKNTEQQCIYLVWVLIGMWKTKKTRLKVLETNFTYVKLYQDSTEEYSPSSTIFLSISDSRVSSDLLRFWTFSWIWLSFSFTEQQSQAGIKILLRLMSKLKLYFHSWNCLKQLCSMQRLETPAFQTSD